MEYIQILTALIGIAGGLLVGVVIERFRLKHELRVQKIKRVAPLLEILSPTVKNLAIDSKYAVELQQTNREDPSVLQRLCEELKEFETWYNDFRQKGMEVELESLDVLLYRSLLGVFVYARYTAKYGVHYIAQRLNSFHRICQIARESLENLLRG